MNFMDLHGSASTKNFMNLHRERHGSPWRTHEFSWWSSLEALGEFFWGSPEIFSPWGTPLSLHGALWIFIDLQERLQRTLDSRVLSMEIHGESSWSATWRSI